MSKLCIYLLLRCLVVRFHFRTVKKEQTPARREMKCQEVNSAKDGRISGLFTGYIVSGTPIAHKRLNSVRAQIHISLFFILLSP